MGVNGRRRLDNGIAVTDCKVESGGTVFVGSNYCLGPLCSSASKSIACAENGTYVSNCRCLGNDLMRKAGGC